MGSALTTIGIVDLCVCEGAAQRILYWPLEIVEAAQPAVPVTP